MDPGVNSRQPNSLSSSSFNLASWKRQLNDDIRPFEQVSFNLDSCCGAIPLENFLANDFDDVDVNYREFEQAEVGGGGNQERDDPDAVASEEEVEMTVVQPPAGQSGGATGASSSLPASAPLASFPPPKVLTRDAALSLLHQTCYRVSGTSEALSFEILAEDPQKMQCVLTVRSLNGSSRSYKTEAIFNKRADAKAAAARMAIEMGVLDFIKTGDSELQKQKNAELLSRAKIDNAGLVEAEEPEDPAITTIETCCREWRAAKVKPHWVWYRHPKKHDAHGTALRIALTAHAMEIYSTEATYPTREEARVACAKVALETGVLDYIKYGNGQKQPEKAIINEDFAPVPSAPSDPLPKKQISLQEYFDTLPKPFPGLADGNSAADIMPVDRVNRILQTAKIPRLKLSYYWASSAPRGGLSGCILRVEQADKVKTYLVDPQFARRADAKSAVCLLAISQGVDDFVRGLKKKFESTLPPNERALATDRILPMLTSRSQRIRSGNRPKFEFVSKQGVLGCVLKLDLSSDPEHPNIREYSVDPMYNSKIDAKLGVACVAAKAGAIELLHFRGETPPEGHRAFWDIINDPNSNDAEKREQIDKGFGEERSKKRKREHQGKDKDSMDTEGEVSSDRREGSNSQLESSSNSKGKGRAADPDSWPSKGRKRMRNEEQQGPHPGPRHSRNAAYPRYPDPRNPPAPYYAPYPHHPPAPFPAPFPDNPYRYGHHADRYPYPQAHPPYCPPPPFRAGPSAHYRPAPRRYDSPPPEPPHELSYD